MLKSILMLLTVGMISACVSGTKPAETYVGRDGQTTLIESDSEMCKRYCNEDYERCMDTRAAGSNNSGIHGPSGVFGASGDCRASLQRCVRGCK